MAEQEEGNIRQEYNAANTGLNMDRSVTQIPKGQLTYALNAAVENFDSNSVNYQNEESQNAQQRCIGQMVSIPVDILISTQKTYPMFS